jgi:hypothetical protein
MLYDAYDDMANITVHNIGGVTFGLQGNGKARGACGQGLGLGFYFQIGHVGKNSCLAHLAPIERWHVLGRREV